ncbi:cation:proton antiporter [Nonomuraea sediminis]|uniref:cation:proton antiporter n=1 Tax=Nonomuraea sediminis TaxID=2835864 RepID=UPI001BDC8612|nr:cation:proton antiporter [Nonomuraea sediminis]
MQSLTQVAVLLLAAVVLGRLARRLGMPPVVGELAAGVALAPLFSGPGPLLEDVGQLGVLLLVALTGAHLDLGLVRRRSGAVAAIGLVALVIPLAGGLAAGVAMAGWSPFAMFLGVAMCVSAIPVIAKTMADMDLLHRDVAHLTLASATVDDVFGWALFSLAAAGFGLGTVRALGGLVAVVLAAIVLRPLARHVLRAGGPAAFVVISFLSASATQALGLEAIFGAFVAGVMAGSCGEPGPVRLAPLRTVVMTVLAPLFFATAGLRMDLTTLAQPAVLVPALALLAIAVAGKLGGGYLGARLAGLRRPEAVAVGAGLNARGAVEVVIAGAALRLGAFTVPMYTTIIVIALVTSLMAPPILRAAMSRLAETPAELRRREDDLIASSS